MLDIYMILKKLYSEKRNLPLQTSEKNARKKIIILNLGRQNNKMIF